jgi:hypothetical protein
MEKITYSAKLSDLNNYKDTEDIYGGTYTNGKPISIDIQIWNNKYGTVDVEDLENFVLNLYFDKYEDNSLLQFITLSRNNVEEVPIDVMNGVATATFYNNVVLKGTANNGDPETNVDNYIDLTLTFNVNNSDIVLKSQDLKNLFLEVVKQ